MTIVSLEAFVRFDTINDVIFLLFTCKWYYFQEHCVDDFYLTAMLRIKRVMWRLFNKVLEFSYFLIIPTNLFFNSLLKIL